MKESFSRRNLLIIGVFFAGLAGSDIVSGILSKPSGLSIILTTISSGAFLIFAILAFFLALFKHIPPKNRE